MPEQKTECFILQDKDFPGITKSFRTRGIVSGSAFSESRIDIFHSDPFGQVMTAGGMVLYAGEDSLFHEMAAYCAACAHEDPRRVLILGAVSFPVAAVLLKIRGIEQADLCEPEEELIGILRRHIPEARKTFGNSRMEIFTEEPDAFLKQHEGCYDLIFDFTPEAPKAFRTRIRIMKKALTQGGILAMLARPYPNAFLRARKQLANLADSFRHVSCALMPFSAGLYGTGSFFLASDETDPARPVRRIPGGQLRAYSRAYHKAIFTHASFWQNKLLNPGGSEDGEEERID